MPYNISEAFEAIEDELIGSMMRNLKRHQAEETRLGFEWEQWQVLQLQALEDYRRRNMKKFPPRFNKLNAQIEEALRKSYGDGRTAQERKILQAIQKGFKTPLQPFSGEAEIEGSFFGVNDRKLDALLNAVNNDMNRAEYAVLRRADDQYRQTIFNAQVYANTGAGTYRKAVDMATRDFLRAGLDCVEYSNGSRHTLEDYADMAIKTANKRAYLQGEGSMRDEWGIPTVIMNKRNCPCPRCAPFVGKVFIDDVWSGGDKSGISPVTGVKYPLMSEAIARGLYHPRCKDVHSTYFEGISTPPEGSRYTADELDEMAQQYEAQQKQGYCERQKKRYDRMSRYSLDEDNQRIYGARAKAFGEKAEQFGKVAKAFEKPVEKSGESGIIESGSDSVALENQRLGRNKSTLVNKTYIDSGEYKRKWDNAIENQKVSKTLYDCAKKALKHRSGTVFEDMYWINSDTGEIILSVTDSNEERAIVYTDKIRNVVGKNENIITLHTHPSSMPPSLSDLNSCYRNNYKKGFVACHNGKIFGYTSNEQINERIYSMYIENYIKDGYDEFEAQLKALEKLSQSYDIKIWEVINHEG